MTKTTIDPNFTSHKNWVQKTNQHLDRILDEEMFINCLQSQWECNEDIITLEERRNTRKTASTAVDVFDYYLDVGFIPPPEILLTIADMFRTYFAHAGTVSLEDVFFGEPKRGVGNYAARKDSVFDTYSKFNIFLSFPVNKNTDRNMIDQAELFFKEQHEWYEKIGHKYEQPDTDTFLRQYRRWKKRRIEDDAEDK